MKIKSIVLWVKNDMGDLITRVTDSYDAMVSVHVPTLNGTLIFEDKEVLEFHKWLDRNGLEGGLLEGSLEIADEEFEG